MIGTIVNALAIIVGGTVGMFLKKHINLAYEESLNKALGVAVLITGLNGVITSMIQVGESGSLTSSGELVLIISLVLGVLCGEKLALDDKLLNLGAKIEKKVNLSGFGKSFVNGSLIYCVGAMAIIGAVNDGFGDPSTLYIKSMLDGISSVVLGATLGPGVIFSSVPVFLYQASISLFAGFLQPLLGTQLMGQICAVGFSLVICIGLNFIGIAKIKTANMLPALLVPPIWYAISFFVL